MGTPVAEIETGDSVSINGEGETQSLTSREEVTSANKEQSEPIENAIQNKRSFKQDSTGKASKPFLHRYLFAISITI